MTRDDFSTIAKRLTWARTRLEQSQEQIAEAAGVSQGTIGNIESGARKQPRELLAIAAAVQVHARWLQTGEGPILLSEAAPPTEADEESLELSDSAFALLQAFDQMSDADQQELLNQALARAEAFKKLAEEAMRKFTPKPAAAQDAFQPGPTPGKKAPFRYDKKNPISARPKNAKRKV